MAENANKVPVTEEKAPERATEAQPWRPFDTLRREVDRLFEDFDTNSWRMPFRRSGFRYRTFLAASAEMG